MQHRTGLLIATLISSLAAAPAFTHGTKSNESTPSMSQALPEQKSFGIAGDPGRVDRTIEIRMSDKMRFEPALVSVKEGETIRFSHRNRGKIMHEMVLGTREELEKHAAVMRKFPKMEHDEPYMAHVAAGKRGEIVWQFNRAGEFEFGCLIPGHFEAGMRGNIKVATK